MGKKKLRLVVSWPPGGTGSFMLPATVVAVSVVAGTRLVASAAPPLNKAVNLVLLVGITYTIILSYVHHRPISSGHSVYNMCTMLPQSRVLRHLGDGGVDMLI